MTDFQNDKQRRLLRAVFGDLSQAKVAVQGDPSLVHARDKVGETAFHYVVVENRLDLAQQLLDLGSDINTCDIAGGTPLMHAVQLGLLDMVKWLVEHGADIDLKDENGETALSKATRNDRGEIFTFLLSVPRRHSIDFYYDDLSAHIVHEHLRPLPMRETLLRLGLSDRFKK